MGAVLFQADPDNEAAWAAKQEQLHTRGKCAFDKTLTGLRLRPVAFLDQMCTASELNYHSYVGKAAAGRWAVGKFQKWFFGAEFTWLTDGSGLATFFEDKHVQGNGNLNRMVQHWRAELLQFHFTIEHCPARMLTKCNVLLRYNQGTTNWTNTTTDTLAAITIPNKRPVTTLFDTTRPAPTPQAFCLPNITNVNATSPNTSTVNTQQSQWDKQRHAFVVGNCFAPIVEALDTTHVIQAKPSTPSLSENHMTAKRWCDYLPQAGNDTIPQVNWYIALYTGPRTNNSLPDQQLRDWCCLTYQLVSTIYCGATAILIPKQFPNKLKRLQQHPTPANVNGNDWQRKYFTRHNTNFHGLIETSHHAMILTPPGVGFQLSDTTADEWVIDPTPMGSVLQAADLSSDTSLNMQDLIQTQARKPNTTTVPPLQERLLEDPNGARIAFYFQHHSTATHSRGHAAYDITRPAPNGARTNNAFKTLYLAPFAILLKPMAKGCRPILHKEIATLLGFSPAHIELFFQHDWWTTAKQRIRQAPGLHGLQQVFPTLLAAKAKQHGTINTNAYSASIMPSLVLDPATTIPLPSHQD